MQSPAIVATDPTLCIFFRAAETADTSVRNSLNDEYSQATLKLSDAIEQVKHFFVASGDICMRYEVAEGALGEW